jgi:hypothetical protein
MLTRRPTCPPSRPASVPPGFEEEQQQSEPAKRLVNAALAYTKAVQKRMPPEAVIKAAEALGLAATFYALR